LLLTSRQFSGQAFGILHFMEFPFVDGLPYFGSKMIGDAALNCDDIPRLIGVPALAEYRTGFLDSLPIEINRELDNHNVAPMNLQDKRFNQFARQADIQLAAWLGHPDTMAGKGGDDSLRHRFLTE
jgi:hypothetical protein